MRKLLLSLLILLQILCFSGCVPDVAEDTQFRVEDYKTVVSAEIVYMEHSTSSMFITALNNEQTKQLIQQLSELEFCRYSMSNEVQGNCIKLIFPDDSYTIFSIRGQEDYKANGEIIRYDYDENGEKRRHQVSVGTPKDQKAFMTLVIKYIKS